MLEEEAVVGIPLGSHRGASVHADPVMASAVIVKSAVAEVADERLSSTCGWFESGSYGWGCIALAIPSCASRCTL